MTTNSDIKIKRGIDADAQFKGTKIVWNEKVDGLIWFNEKSYKATVDHWHLFSYSECPGTFVFPNLHFQKVAQIPNAITNNIQGLVIFPYTDVRVKESASSLMTTDGISLVGTGFDLDNDGVLDVFTYVEEIDETTRYIRLFVNVGGQWKFKWANLDEDCI